MATALIAGTALLAALPTLSIGAATPPLPTTPSSNPYDYALFGTSTLSVQSGFISGNLGAGAASTWDPVKPFAGSNGANQSTGTYRLQLCQGSGSIFSSQNFYIAAPSVNLGSAPHCQVKRAFALVTDPSPPSTTEYPARSTWTPPNVVLPPLPTTAPSLKGVVPVSRACSAPDFSSVALPTSVTYLTPNTTYGNISIPNGKVVALAAGATYTFCSVSVSSYASLQTDAGTIVNIVGNASVTNGGLGGSDDTKFFIGGTSVNFGHNSIVSGTFDAPNASVALGHDSSVDGHVWAKDIHSDVGLHVTGGTTTTTTSTPATSAPTTTSTSTTTTTVAPTTTTSTTSTTTSTTSTTTTIKPTTTTSSTSTSSTTSTTIHF